MLKAKRPGFTDERFNETEYYFEKGKNQFFKIIFLRIYLSNFMFTSYCMYLNIKN